MSSKTYDLLGIVQPFVLPIKNSVKTLANDDTLGGSIRVVNLTINE